MTNLSQEALYNLCYSAISFGDSLFELWLTITFAAILAIFFASERITPFMRRLLLALYGGTALLLTGRWVVAMTHVLTYQRMLRDAGFEAFPSPIRTRSPLGVLHFLMFAVGSVATLYFMHSFRHARSDRGVQAD
jgi:hypothetical protein